jgi:hypothetical protein
MNLCPIHRSLIAMSGRRSTGSVPHSESVPHSSQPYRDEWAEDEWAEDEWE